MSTEGTAQRSLSRDELEALANCISNVDNCTSGFSGATSAHIVRALVKVGNGLVWIEYDEAGDLSFTAWGDDV